MKRLYWLPAVVLSTVAAHAGAQTSIFDKLKLNGGSDPVAIAAYEARTRQADNLRIAVAQDTHKNDSGIVLPPIFNPEAQRRADEVNGQALVYTNQARELLIAGKLAAAEQACLKSIAIQEDFYASEDYFGRSLLGEIYLKGGQNEKALKCFRLVYPHGADDKLNLNIALTFCQMGNYREAFRFYSIAISHDTTQRSNEIDPSNRPGTETLPELHASVLLARSIEAGLHVHAEESLANFKAADKLIPKNPTIHYFWAEVLRHTERPAEAIGHYQIAIQRGNGMLLKNAKQGLAQAHSTIENRALFKAQQAKKLAEQKAQAPGNATP